MFLVIFLVKVRFGFSLGKGKPGKEVRGCWRVPRDKRKGNHLNGKDRGDG